MLMFSLTIAVMETGALNGSLPKTSYLKMIDVFTGFSITLIFGAIVEFVIVQRMRTNEEIIGRTGQRLDRLGRTMYPIAFAGFILIYFYAGVE